ncbi:hypothetical protein [Microseira sp. BLCC-F43]|jgi:hypothetical protein|uniref:hypothetical protein n=1 Tax=Microseira sp. BLCC-F43 TaxID=3153602 RepID=UPI0035B82EBC
MQAYKLKGIVDEAGNLAISSPVKMPPGEVEIIILQAVETVDNDTPAKSNPENATPKRQSRTKIKAFQDWFEKTQPAPPDFDPDQARWEALKEKHNL